MAASGAGDRRADVHRRLTTLAQGTFVALSVGGFLLAFGALRVADAALPARSEAATITDTRKGTESRRVEDADGERRTERVTVYELTGRTESGARFAFEDAELFEAVEEDVAVTVRRSRLTDEVRGISVGDVEWSALGGLYWTATGAALLFGACFALSGVLGAVRLGTARREAEDAGVEVDRWGRPGFLISAPVVGLAAGALAVWILGLRPR